MTSASTTGERRPVVGLNVLGESMVPRFRNGELIYVQLREPVPGDDVVVELCPEREGEPSKTFLAELVKATRSRLYCRQHNPRRDIEFDRSEILRLWRVLTLRELLHPGSQSTQHIDA